MVFGKTEHDQGYFLKSQKMYLTKYFCKRYQIFMQSSAPIIIDGLAKSDESFFHRFNYSFGF